MPNYWQLLLLIVPVFALMAMGVVLRQVRWLTTEADESLLKLVVNFLYPCLIFENVHANPALRDSGNLGWAPVVGFVTMVAGIGICFWAAGWLRLTVGTGRRTFAVSTGVYNWSYITVPLLVSLFGVESLGVLFLHNVGCEAAIWMVGVVVLSGQSLRSGWRKIFSPPIIALALGAAVNLAGLAPAIPEAALDVVHALAACAIPLGLLLSGATMAENLLGTPRELFDLRTSLSSVVLRLALLPVLFLVLARLGPFSEDLKRVIVVQASMPAAFLPLVLVKHYGGHQLTAVRVVLATTLAGVLLIPWWLRIGMAWVGL